IEPNLQMVCRDRNRIAIQSDLLGASALGIKNVLCLSGDHQKFGDHPQAKNVFDLDSMQLIATVKKMRDEGKLINEHELEGVPKFFIGAAENPFADPFEFRRTWMQQAYDMGLTEKCAILAGITPLKSVGMARYMQKFVPGLDVPDSYINRLKGVDKKLQGSEGIKMAIEQIQEIKEIKGIAGFHVMAIEWEERVEEIVSGAGLLPRPQVS
ncbi:MAG: methylenetetrahydrofolate reductase, partial [Deltaproteobacteria bacterium]|nr:methylenetetrahydrofolate reductase [Deltaproteobacteria bacterium]